ncbi:hypothetical protein NDU88_004450 [Pleurodeles waltl]|uniref:Secreted protein n=1 Tax=Pleurodeles waltl TaxID=8319 RepID=A0AAV7VGA7_PLEWA|nr:hypothetical protein NDU88_004450 [Pleurodeles waltl]
MARRPMSVLLLQTACKHTHRRDGGRVGPRVKTSPYSLLDAGGSPAWPPAATPTLRCRQSPGSAIPLPPPLRQACCHDSVSTHHASRLRSLT